ncbi:MAG: DUF2878 domain-containing protein [Chromatiales bacterium]|nr:DUF2878 domain-containing protein [Chromatiales bacterium]
MYRRAANFVLFQVVWLLSLLGAGNGLPWLGAAAFTLFAAWHLGGSRTRGADLRLLLVAALAGLFVDTFYVQAGLLSYSAPLPVDGLAPFWILIMWMNFALTVNESLNWLHGRPWLAAALGAVGGPLAYWAGIGLGAAALTGDALLAFIVLALSWGLAVPLLFSLAARWTRQCAAITPPAPGSVPGPGSQVRP